MSNPFESIQDIPQRRLAFLEDEIKHYNLSNRSVYTKNSVENCSYTPAHENTLGCAIGRWLDRDNPIISTPEIGENKIVNLLHSHLPTWMRQMGVGFLAEAQKLHDFHENWDENGLSEQGKEFVLYIKEHYVDNR